MLLLGPCSPGMPPWLPWHALEKVWLPWHALEKVPQKSWKKSPPKAPTEQRPPTEQQPLTGPPTEQQPPTGPPTEQQPRAALNSKPLERRHTSKQRTGLANSRWGACPSLYCTTRVQACVEGALGALHSFARLRNAVHTCNDCRPCTS